MNKPIGMIQPMMQPMMQTMQFRGFAGCYKCGGTGYKFSKKKSSKRKPCKDCIKRSGCCPKCNNTGYKIGKPGKVCKCRKFFGGILGKIFF
jgi:hypothetical protein